MKLRLLQGPCKWPYTLIGKSGEFSKTAHLSSSLGRLLKPLGLPCLGAWPLTVSFSGLRHAAHLSLSRDASRK